MWKLIIISSFIWKSFSFDQAGFIVLIMDDCHNWSAVPNNALKYKSDFIYSKNLPKYQSVSLGHIWFDPKPKPSTQTISYSEIIKMEPNYTSEMNFEDWFEVVSKGDKKKIYLLRPEDYCSEKRFVFNHQFVLYEVRIHLSGDE